MNNIYFKELFELAEDFNKFWHRKYYEVNIRGSRTYKNFNDYYQKHLEGKKQEQEKYNDPNREVSEAKRKLIRDLITNEKSIKKEGLEFIVFTYKMKRYRDINSFEDLLSNDNKRRAYFIYNTSVIVSYEEKVGDHYESGSIENTFCSIAKTKPKSDRQFKETCELIENSTIEELMEMLRKEFKQSKNVWKKRFEEELEEKKKMQEESRNYFMPNWVKTIVKTKPDVLKDILKKYSNEDGFSFEKVIPMPKELDVERGSRGQDGLMYLFLENDNGISKEKINQVFRSLNPFFSDIYKEKRFKMVEEKYSENKSKTEYNESVKLAKQYIYNYNKYGYADWYNWRCDNWGTKWDLTELDYNKDTMIFQTAWNFAGNVILELSRRYPEAVFECKFADEGMQENSGILKIKDGEVFEEKYNLEMESIDKIWDYYLDDSEKESSNEEIDNEIEMEY